MEAKPKTKPNYRKMQQYSYEKEWKTLDLSHLPGTSGWRTTVPSQDFVEFTDYLVNHRIAGKILDLGCGAGRHAVALAAKGFKVYALDFSESAIKKARKYASDKRVLSK